MSFTKGVSFHHETNASSHPNISNNITINASNELSNSNPSVIIESKESSEKVEYPPSTESSTVEAPNIQRENEFLKKVLDLYMNQRIFWSGKYIVLTANELLGLIQILLPKTQLKLFTDDIEVNCCGASKDVPYEKVDSIWFDNEKHEQLNLKYAHSDIVALLESYKISIKFVRSN